MRPKQRKLLVVLAVSAAALASMLAVGTLLLAARLYATSKADDIRVAFCDLARFGPVGRAIAGWYAAGRADVAFASDFDQLMIFDRDEQALITLDVSTPYSWATMRTGLAPRAFREIERVERAAGPLYVVRAESSDPLFGVMFKRKEGAPCVTCVNLDPETLAFIPPHLQRAKDSFP